MQFTEPVMRPPSEAHSLLLRATQGCSYNDCHFCYVSRNHPFMAATVEQFEEEAASRKDAFPEDTPVYLVGANPFVLPAARLRDYIAVLRRHYPRFSRLSMQSRIMDIPGKTDEELAELRRLGLSHLYIGTENGHDGVLKLFNKGNTAADAVGQLLRLDRAGIRYTLFYVLGLGGRGMGRACALATAAMFNQVHPELITTTGMTIFENTPLADMVREGTFVEAGEREKIEELRLFLQELTVDTRYDGIHYLNPLNYRFSNSDAEEKARVLADIDEVLATCSDEELELMVSRGQMRSL
ncbi:MAG: radical SAM protein [Desulfovibrionaceae bacterium]|nr:radical SAM protein [Desulfovibrionaceae bacterium]